jgi:hypothetical protein
VPIFPPPNFCHTSFEVVPLITGYAPDQGDNRQSEFGLVPLGSTLPPTAEPMAVRPILCKARPCPKGTN